MPKKEETDATQPKKTGRKRLLNSKERDEHSKPTPLVAPRRGLQKPTEYSANWKALSKVCGW